MRLDKSYKFILMRIYFFLLYLLIFVSISSFGFPIIIDFFIIIILFFIINNLFSLLFLFFLILALLSTNILFIDKIKDKEIYYRAHEKFSDANYIYQKNINHEMLMPYGDIVALDFCNDLSKIKQARKEKFITDENGYRNDSNNLSNADIILVGDSFIAGIGNTQEDIPANILMNLIDKKVYSLTAIADPRAYEYHIKRNLNNMNENAKLLIFYFAGNDFNYHFEQNSKYLNYNGIQTTYIKYKTRFFYETLERNKDKLFIKILNKFYQKNFFYKKIRPKSQRIFKKFLSKWTNSCPVKYHNINNLDVGFYYNELKNYVSVNTHIISDQNVLKKIHKIYYIPTKYEVYKKYFSKEDVRNDDLIYLKDNYEKLGIQVIDLTPILKLAADEYLKNNEFIYWRDDTHWNRLGIFSAMKFIKDDLKK
jgi:hypothetical protein